MAWDHLPNGLPNMEQIRKNKRSQKTIIRVLFYALELNDFPNIFYLYFLHFQIGSSICFGFVNLYGALGVENPTEGSDLVDPIMFDLIIHIDHARYPSTDPMARRGAQSRHAGCVFFFFICVHAKTHEHNCGTQNVDIHKTNKFNAKTKCAVINKNINTSVKMRANLCPAQWTIFERR